MAGQIAEARRAARVADRRQRVVHVRRRLGVDGDAVGAGLGELAHLALGALDHQVHVEDPAGVVDLVGDRLTTSGPIVIGGTKCPSITSTWITRAPGGHHLGRPARRGARSRPRGSTGRDAALPQQAPRACPSSDRLEHAALAVVAGHDRGARHPHDRRVLAAVGAHRHELVALQAVHAAVAAGGGWWAAATARRSRAFGPRSTRPSVYRRVMRPTWAHTRGVSARAAAGDEEPVGPVAMGQLQARGAVRPTAELLQVLGLPSGMAREEPVDHALVLGRRDRAHRVDQRPAGPHRVGAGGEDPSWTRRATSPRLRARRASAGRAGTGACPGRCTAGRRARDRTDAGARGDPAPDRIRRVRAPTDAAGGIARRCAAAPSARPGWRSTATRALAPPISAARCVVLPPGRGAQVEHPLAGLRDRALAPPASTRATGA